MSHRLLEHVGEVELALEAESEEGLFTEAVAVYRELVDGSSRRGEALRWEVALPAASDELLLVDWLNELIFLAEVEAFVPERVDALELADGLRAAVVGVRGDPRPLVKAATLHGLELSCNHGVWHAHVVLDI